MEITAEIEQTEKTQQKNKFLVSETKLILHTKVARVLFNGEWKYGRLGLVQFARLMSPLWKAFKEDDPYAEQTLIKTREALEKTMAKMKEHETALQQQLNNLRGFVIGLYQNPSPFNFPLKFSTPLPFLAAFLIEQVDYINRQLFTLKRIGLTPDNKLTPADLMREVQAIFRLPMTWKYTGVTRKDIAEGNQKAQKAIKSLALSMKTC